MVSNSKFSDADIEEPRVTAKPTKVKWYNGWWGWGTVERGEYQSTCVSKEEMEKREGGFNWG